MIEYVFFPEKNHFEPLKLIFASFQIAPMICPNPWFGI